MSTLRQLAVLAALVALAASPARAQVVRNANRPQLGSMDRIQVAVDSAEEGDVLLLSPGIHQGFEIEGKSLWILRFPYVAPTAYPYFIQGDVEVRGLAADQEVVLAFERINGRILLRDNRGAVRIQHLEQLAPTFGGGPLQIVDCDQVSLSESIVTNHQPGTTGLEVVRSNVILHDTVITGGPGFVGSAGAGPGAHLTDAFLVLSGSKLAGGDALQVNGGHGVEAVGRSLVQLLGSSLTPGSATTPGLPGVPFRGSGLLLRTPEAPPLATLSPQGGDDLLVEGADRRLVVSTGAVGGRALLLDARLPGWTAFPPPLGVGLLTPGSIRRSPLGPLGRTATQEFVLPGLPLRDAQALRKVHSQVALIDASGRAWLGSPLPSVVLNADADPDCKACTDCDGDGRNDLVQLYERSLDDCNLDLVPDVCQLATGALPDCNGNGRPDDCDIAQNLSLDLNGNGIPDECEP